jgi:hypothetical protein
MSSLIPERPLVISPSLATTIGLEEAVLLQVLNDLSTFGSGSLLRGYQWHSFAHRELEQLLPFWQPADLQRVSQSLVAKGIILLDDTANGQPNGFCFAMNEPASAPDQQQPLPSYQANQPPSHQASHQPQHQPALQQPSQQPAAPRANKGASLLPRNWQPSDDLLQLLQLNHNIPREFCQQQLEDFLLYWQDRQQVSHSWPSKFRQHVLKEWRFKQSQQAVVSRKQQQNNDINNEWYPSPDALEIMQRSGVSADFIDDAIPEFVLYWRERGEAHSTWNSKFIAHIRRQWAKFTKTMELDYEPREIAANWQPSEDVYDILLLANIEIEFARQLVPEFVLFWRDTKQIQRSWNTKFLQHAKYQWATRHQMGQHYARQQLPAGSAQAERKSTFDRLTDRSWAKDLIEDS